MTFGETVFWFYVTIATVLFSAGVGYMAFCGLRQWIDDARTGGAYRVEDEKFRKIARGI